MMQLVAFSVLLVSSVTALSHHKKITTSRTSAPEECGPNEVHSNCTIQCPPQTCESISAIYNCDEIKPCKSGCDCISGFLRNKQGICVDNCSQDTCDVPKECRKTCEQPNPPNCTDEEQPTENVDGCKCQVGYVLDKFDGSCVKVEDCNTPEECGPNEVHSNCTIQCPPQTCESISAIYNCDEIKPCKSGCDCISGFLRNKQGICVDNCSQDTCDVPKECRKTCEQPNPPNCTDEEQPTENVDGCKCQVGYVLDKFDGSCVKIEDCNTPEECGPNEVHSNCTIQCPPQTCESISAIYNCDEIKPCKSGCDCISGFLRNKQGICVDNCSQDTCDVPKECRKTCEQPNPPNCTDEEQPTENVDGCKCQVGYVLDKFDGSCVKIEDCNKKSCNGDQNAVITSCTSRCPATCEQTEPTFCILSCGPVGCQCASGYIYSNTYGRCIRSEDCTGLCGVNETYADCSFHCPNQDCPTDDSRITILCKPGRPCPPGCMCKDNYKRKSDNSCVLASDCPPVNCTRPNEVFDASSSECLAEKCSDMYETNPCDASLNPSYIPRCVCKKGYARDDDDMCVAVKKCPNSKETTTESTKISPKAKHDCDKTGRTSTYQNSSSYSSAFSSSYTSSVEEVTSNATFTTRTTGSKRSRCIATCAEPMPAKCATVSNGGCKDGHIMSQRGGKCIKVEDCPQDLGCNADKNAVIKTCVGCRSTCVRPNSLPCDEKCSVGCGCKPGYMLSKNGGKCIQPDQCRGGNPCGPNATFVDCNSVCPTDYCPEDDRQATPICETYPFSPCYSGCRCKLNHRIKSREDRTCILASECQPVICTRPNEIWNSCPSDCLAESCADIDNQPSTCNTFVLNCQPKCVCRNGFFRNSERKCVSKNECRNFQQRNSFV